MVKKKPGVAATPHIVLLPPSTWLCERCQKSDDTATEVPLLSPDRESDFYAAADGFYRKHKNC